MSISGSVPGIRRGPMKTTRPKIFKNVTSAIQAKKSESVERVHCRHKQLKM